MQKKASHIRLSGEEPGAFRSVDLARNRLQKEIWWAYQVQNNPTLALQETAAPMTEYERAEEDAEVEKRLKDWNSAQPEAEHLTSAEAADVVYGGDSNDTADQPAENEDTRNTRGQMGHYRNSETADLHWGFNDALINGIEDYMGTEPSQTHLRHFKDSWVREKRDVIKRLAKEHNIPPEFLAGVAWTETGGAPEELDAIAHTIRHIRKNTTEGRTFDNVAEDMLRSRDHALTNFFANAIFTDPNRTSVGDVQIQIRRVAEVEGLDPEKLTFEQERAILNRMQDEDANLEVVARHIAKERDQLFPELGNSPMTQAQIERLGYAYNLGADHEGLQPGTDLESIRGIGGSLYGTHILEKYGRMRDLLNK